MKKQIAFFIILIMNLSCGVYTFTDASIPPEVKTIKINMFKNSALLVNPIINTQATNELITKIRNQTRLFVVNSGTPDYEISGTITNYGVTTTGIANNQVAKNQLTLGINYSFVNNLANIVTSIKNQEFPLSVNEEFDATKTLLEVETSLLSTMIPQITTQAFNKIFSSW